ncbi:MAG: hypothetical protein SWH68_16595 [Thermodesulfobacteriota bacterium]|nr:hypothetical protein [Thermodesulfobacteriota bacterium]
MKFKILFFVLVLALVSAVFLAGCGAKKSVTGPESHQIISSLDTKNFEVARNELMVQFFPNKQDTEDFQAIYPIIMDAPTTRLRGEGEPKFMKDLDALLRKDLGIGVDYRKMDKRKKIKTTRKAGFVWDPKLFWSIALKKAGTGSEKIEIYTEVQDSARGLDPSGLRLETFIRVKSGSRLLKEYKTTASFHARMDPRFLKAQLEDYFVHIPELLINHMPYAIIGNSSIAKDIEWVKTLRSPPPEDELLKMKDMIQDAWEAENLPGENAAGAAPSTDTDDQEPAEGGESGTGATLLD